MAKKTPDVMSVPCEDTFARMAHAINPEAFTRTELDRAVNSALGEIGKPKSIWPAVLEVQLNGLLSGLGTPLANAASVVYKQVANPMIDLVESINPKSDKNFFDVMAGVQAQLHGFVSDLIYFRSGWVNGYPLDMELSIRDTARRLNITQSEARKKLTDAIIEERVALAIQRDTTLDPKAVRETLKKNFKPSDAQIEAFVKESYDYMRGAIPSRFGGEVIRMPTKLSVAIDEYGKARFRRYKIAMLASRKAREESGKDSTKYKELYEKYLKQSMKHMEFDEGVRTASAVKQADAVKASFDKMSDDLDSVFGAELLPYKTVKEYALREMFQQRLTGIPKAVQESRHKYPALHLLVPFLKTPWNITKEGFSYVPGLPQVMRKYIMKPEYKLDKDGLPTIDQNQMGAFYEFTSEELIARQLIAAGAFTWVMTLAQEGKVTGKPRNAQEAQAWRDAGIPQSSFQIGDTWYSYERIEPVATVLGLSAEIARTWNQLEDMPEVDRDEQWATEVGKGTFAALKANMIQKSFIEGFSGFVDDVANSASSGTITPIATGIGRQFTPALLNQIARAMDPYERQATTFGEKMQQRIPFAREELPIDYGLFGEARQPNLAQVWTSFNIKDAEQTPLQKYVYDLGVTKMREDKDLKGVDLDNEQLATLRQMTAEFVTPRLERYVASESFRKLTDAQKKVRLERYIDRLKRVPRERFAAQLRKTNPQMAIKFRNEIYRNIGRPERLRDPDEG